MKMDLHLKKCLSNYCFDEYAQSNVLVVAVDNNSEVFVVIKALISSAVKVSILNVFKEFSKETNNS